MSAVYGWVKNIVYFYIFITAVLHLLPKSSYQKYVRFFGGLLLVILLITPIFDFFSNEGVLLDKISYLSFWQEMDTMQLDVAGMEGAQKKAYMSEYESAIENDVALMAEENELYVNQVSVSLNEDYTIGEIRLSVSLESPGGIYLEKITQNDNSQEYPKVMKLKNKMIEFYQIESEQVQIVVQEDSQ